MAIEFSSPQLIAAATKLAGVQQEFEDLQEFVKREPLGEGDRIAQWGVAKAIAASIHDIYNGLEDVMLVVCKNVDNFKPNGGNWHREIVDQLSSPLKNVRPAVLDTELSREIGYLRGFRHFINHGYAIRLETDKVSENLTRVQAVVPAFEDAMKALDDYLSRDPEPGESAFDPFRK